MSKPEITIHYGASNDDITVDGHTFTRHKLDRREQRFLRNVVIDSLIKVGRIKRWKGTRK